MTRYGIFHRVRAPTPPGDPLTIAWVAGFSDAESSLSYRSGCAAVSVSNCHLPTLLQLCEWFGGSVRNHTPETATRRPCFQWNCGGPLARAFLRAVMPHLREKRAQAELILSEPVGKPGHLLSDEDFARRARMRVTLAAMKRVRYPAAGR